MKNTIILTDTFNARKISTHRTVLAAVRARITHGRAVERGHGKGCYVHYQITAADGRDLGDEIYQAEMDLHNMQR